MPTRANVQEWQGEVSHIRGRLLGIVEDMVRSHCDGVEAFLHERAK